MSRKREKKEISVSIGVRIPKKLLELVRSAEPDKSFSMVVRELLEREYSFSSLKSREIINTLPLNQRIELLEEEINRLMEEIN